MELMIQKGLSLSWDPSGEQRQTAPHSIRPIAAQKKTTKLTEVVSGH